ncbi:MAG: DUF547 domain-containing protein [Candidatus Methylumidiphilus sp.]
MLMKQWAVLFVALLPAFGVFAGEPDWRGYAEVLQSSVTQGSKHGTQLALVDYAGLKKSGALDAVYRTLAAFPLAELNSREEKLAFYINAYNILALKTVVDHWPVESIKDVGNLIKPVWDKPAGELGGKAVTLGQIEHTVLRPMGEPRIHLAIVCASVSCPDLRNEPYTAAQLDRQLDEQAQRFMDNRGKGLQVADGQIRVSKIFDWFGKDFDKSGGVEAFVRRYRPQLPSMPVEADIAYDWAVNGVSTEN